MRTSDYPDMMTVPEMAAFLRISKPTAYGLINSGTVPSARFGRQIRVYKQDLIDLCHSSQPDGDSQT